MKSERTTGFVPVDQFENPHAKAHGDLGNPKQITSTKYIFEQVAQLSKDKYLPKVVIEKIVEDQHNNEVNLKASLDAHSPPERSASSLIKYLYDKAARKEPKIDGHKPASISEIMGDKKVGSNKTRREHLEDIFKKEGFSKKYVVYEGLPIIGDYDIYKLHVPKKKEKAFGQLPKKEMDTSEGRTNIPGVGYTTPYVIGSVIDYNVAVALSGYDGGLVFHHAAEMDNLKNIQKKGPVIFIEKDKTMIAGDLQGDQDKVGQDIHGRELEIERNGRVTRNRSDSEVYKKASGVKS